MLHVGDVSIEGVSKEEQKVVRLKIETVVMMTSCMCMRACIYVTCMCVMSSLDVRSRSRSSSNFSVMYPAVCIGSMVRMAGLIDSLKLS